MSINRIHEMAESLKAASLRGNVNVAATMLPETLTLLASMFEELENEISRLSSEVIFLRADLNSKASEVRVATVETAVDTKTVNTEAKPAARRGRPRKDRSIEPTKSEL